MGGFDIWHGASAAQVKAGNDHTGSAGLTAGRRRSADGRSDTSPAPSGLTASTAYTIHFMHEDAAANQSSVSSGDGFTTASGGVTLASKGNINTSAPGTTPTILTSITANAGNRIFPVRRHLPQYRWLGHGRLGHGNGENFTEDVQYLQYGQGHAAPADARGGLIRDVHASCDLLELTAAVGADFWVVSGQTGSGNPIQATATNQTSIARRSRRPARFDPPCRGGPAIQQHEPRQRHDHRDAVHAGQSLPHRDRIELGPPFQRRGLHDARYFKPHRNIHQRRNAKHASRRSGDFLMAYRYIYNDSLLAEGERTVVLQNGKLYVRTGVLGTTDDQINYRLREVYDDAAAGVARTDHLYRKDALMPSYYPDRQLLDPNGYLYVKAFKINFGSGVQTIARWDVDSTLGLRRRIWAFYHRQTAPWRCIRSRMSRITLHLERPSMSITELTIARKSNPAVEKVYDLSADPMEMVPRHLPPARILSFPSLVSVSPGGTNVSPATKVTLVWDEQIVAGRENTISLVNNTTSATIETFDLTQRRPPGLVRWKSSAFKVIITPTNVFSDGVVVTPNIPAGAFEDLAGNACWLSLREHIPSPLRPWPPPPAPVTGGILVGDLTGAGVKVHPATSYSGSSHFQLVNGSSKPRQRARRQTSTARPIP